MKLNEIFFANEKLKDAYFELESGKFEEKELFKFINRAIDDLKIICLVLEWFDHKEYEGRFHY
jgi:hypothetical protein